METSLTTSKQAGRLALNQTIGYFAAFISLGMTAASLGPTLPGLAEQTRSEISAISILFTGRSFGYMLGSLLGGRAFDRVRGHTLIAATLIIVACGMALAPVIPYLWLLALNLLILGLAEGATDVGGNTMLIWVHQRRVGPFMNALHFFFGFGAFLAPVVVAQAIKMTGGIGWAYWILAIYTIPVVIWLARLPSPRPVHSAQTGERLPINRRFVAVIVLYFVLYVGAESSFGGWVYTYATSLGLAGPANAAYLTSLFWGAFTIGRLVSIPLAARLHPQTMLSWDLVGCLLSMAIILLFPESLLALGIGSAGLGFSMASMFPGMLVYAERQMHLSGKITGWFLVGGGLGAMFLPWMIGQLFEPLGAIAVMWIILADLMLTVVAFVAVLTLAARRRSSASIG
jgi:FHS family Na+ dependent glucose MFS transporter 1